MDAVQTIATRSTNLLLRGFLYQNKHRRGTRTRDKESCAPRAIDRLVYYGGVGTDASAIEWLIPPHISSENLIAVCGGRLLSSFVLPSASCFNCDRRTRSLLMTWPDGLRWGFVFWAANQQEGQMVTHVQCCCARWEFLGFQFETAESFLTATNYTKSIYAEFRHPPFPFLPVVSVMPELLRTHIFPAYSSMHLGSFKQSLLFRQ